jgi:hypothetical protein
VCNAKGGDRQNYAIGDREINADSAPEVPDICGGDYLFPDICLDCGQTQGKFPKPVVDRLESEDDDDV